MDATLRLGQWIGVCAIFISVAIGFVACAGGSCGVVLLLRVESAGGSYTIDMAFVRSTDDVLLVMDVVTSRAHAGLLEDVTSRAYATLGRIYVLEMAFEKRSLRIRMESSMHKYAAWY